MTVVSEPVPIVYVKLLSLVTTVTWPGTPVTPVPRGTVLLGLPGFELVGKGGALWPVPRGTDLEASGVVLGPVLRGTGEEERGLPLDPVPAGVEMVLERGVTDVTLVFDAL